MREKEAIILWADSLMWEVKSLKFDRQKYAADKANFYWINLGQVIC